jgi:hypothetical protein
VNQFDSITFRIKIFDSIATSFGFLAVICLIVLGIYPIGNQVFFWLEHDIWVEKDLVTYLRYLDISPYTDMKGLNRIIEWFVSIHISVYALPPSFLLLWVFGHFAELSRRLENVIIVGSETETGEITPQYVEEDLKKVPSYGLHKIYPVLRRIYDLPIWSPLDRIWFYFSRVIIWGFLIFLVFSLVYGFLIDPYMRD